MSRVYSWLTKAIHDFVQLDLLSDVVAIVGITLIFLGIEAIYPPAAMIFVGAALVGAVFMARRG